MTGSISLASNSYLVANQGIRIPEPQLISTPYVREVPAEVIQTTKSVGEVTATSTVEYNGEEQTQEAMEGAGFFSIVSSSDINQGKR